MKVKTSALRWVNSTSAFGSQHTPANIPGAVNGHNPLDAPGSFGLFGSSGSSGSSGSYGSSGSTTESPVPGGSSSSNSLPGPLIVIGLVLIVICVGLGAKFAISSYDRAEDDSLKSYTEADQYESTWRYASPRDIWTPSALELGTGYREPLQRDTTRQDLFAPAIHELEVGKSLSDIERCVRNHHIPMEHPDERYDLRERRARFPMINLQDDTETVQCDPLAASLVPLTPPLGTGPSWNPQSLRKDSIRSPDLLRRASPRSQGVIEGGTIHCEAKNCTQVFPNQHEYKHHLRYHNKPEKCPDCERSFGTVTHLRRHINDVHNTMRKYFCTVPTCKYSRNIGAQSFFTRRDNLRRHMLLTHSLSVDHLNGPEGRQGIASVEDARGDDTQV